MEDDNKPQDFVRNTFVVGSDSKESNLKEWISMCENAEKLAKKLQDTKLDAATLVVGKSTEVGWRKALEWALKDTNLKIGVCRNTQDRGEDQTSEEEGLTQTYNRNKNTEDNEKATYADMLNTRKKNVDIDKLEITVRDVRKTAEGGVKMLVHSKKGTGGHKKEIEEKLANRATKLGNAKP